MTEAELDAIRARMVGKESSATLAEVNELTAKLAKIRDQKTEMEALVSTISAEIEATNQRIIDVLIENELTSYKSPSGLISVSHIFTAKLPQGADKVECFNYLKSIGRFDDMASIHSATLNSWVKEQYDIAKEKGEDEPKIPGITDVKTLLRLSFRRSK